MLRAIALAIALAVASSAVAAADLTVKGCSGNWLFDPTTNTATCGNSAPPLPPPPPPSVISCAGYTKTIVKQLPWDRQDITPTTGFTKTTAYVGVLHIPVAGNSNGQAWAAIAEYGDAPHMRVASISDKPCDWSANVQTGIEPNLRFTVAPAQIPGYPMFQPGQTVYVNVYNTNCGAGGTTCNIIVQFSKPQ